jgi:hypothetical protein
MEPPVASTKKQKSKWSLGNLFRRRTTNKLQQEASQSSSEDESNKKPLNRSFLGHRRSNRKRSERKAAEKSAKIKIEQPQWSGSANSLAGSSEGFGSHSSLTRKDRRELLKARVEAVRRDSSSEDNDCTLKQSGSLTRFKSDDSLASLNRRSRAARTERYIKRMEKSSEPEIIPPANWNAAVMGYRETSPYVRAVSATPSPIVSPKMAHRAMPLHMMSPPRMRRSYCCEPPPFLPRHGGAIPPQMYPNSAFIPFTPKQAPPPPPRDPMRKIIGPPHHYVNVEPKPVYRSRSDHQLPQSDLLQTNLFPSSSQTHFKYLADRTPRSRRPIHVIPVHEQSPECILPTPPAWLNEPPSPKKSMSPPIRRVSSIEVTLRAPSRTPPPPPIRRYSRQGSVSSVEDEVPKPLPPPKLLKHTSSNNLEDALNELEEIYQSLQLGDEDLMDRAERRDLQTAFQMNRATSADISDDNIVLRRSTRATPLRRSGVPDLVMDDMAFRRLNNPTTGPPSKDRTSGSYLLVSPALSPIPVQIFDPEEPNTTLDDMSYRAIKDANQFNSKVQDPQPPFGIPLAPAPPASNNDYLHAKPTDKYRPTFRPRKTPDVVNDDLAFRNLRKDNNKVGELKRKRAVRSLSANLMNLMDQREDIEKTQSLVNLPDSLQILYEGTEMRSSPSSRPPPSWVERANLLDTSTETLTQSRANLKSLRNSFLSSEAESRPLSLFMPACQSSAISPIKEVASSIPSSASTEYSVPFDEEKLEELLSALAQEAHDTSERLGRELERLRDGSHSVEDLSKSPTLYQGKQCEVLKFETTHLTSSTNYVPVYNHSESETNPPKALHEDVNNNSKPDFETEKAPAPLTDTLETSISSQTFEQQCTQYTPPEPKKFESPRSRTTSSQSELCTIEEECQFEEDGIMQFKSKTLDEIPRVVIEEFLSDPLDDSFAEDTLDSKVSGEETARSCDEDIFTMLVEESEGFDARDQFQEDPVVTPEQEDEDSEEKSVEQPSSEDDGRESMCQKFNIPKLNLENIDENIDYDEEQFENLYNESFSEEIDEEAVLEFENLSNLIIVETANTVLSCEHVHLPSESSCLSSINSSLTLDESISKCSENVPENFNNLFNRNNNVPEVESKVDDEEIYSINETVDCSVEKSVNNFKAFSESSGLVMGSESKSPAEDETDQSSHYELNVKVDANGNDSTIETPFADIKKTTSELLVTNEEDCDPVEEAEQYSLTDHSTLLLPLLQMAKADNHPSSTFQSTVEKLDALIAAASDVDTTTHASCIFENNNCKSSHISRADDSAFEEVPSDERDTSGIVLAKAAKVITRHQHRTPHFSRLDDQHSMDYFVFLGAVLALVSIITAIANIAAR